MDNETIKFDCFRGCAVSKAGEEEGVNCSYRPGCCKLADRNWLGGVEDGSCPDIFEVRFKNTRKGFYINDSGQKINTGDLVIVEASNGHDLGIVTLAGPIVARQLA